MASLTIENYVKTIYMICSQDDNRPASTGRVAEALKVAPGTVTSMLRTLNENGLAEYTRYEGVLLTDSGRDLALRVLRRHRLIEVFLVKTLNLSWDEVHAEAENMEHAVSDLLVDRIDEFLGFPESDPHGDPIPRADGSVPTPESKPLAECSVGEEFKIVRVLDQASDFLRYLSENGLDLGATGSVLEHLEHAAVTRVQVDGGRETTLSTVAAEKMLVTAVQ